MRSEGEAGRLDCGFRPWIKVQGDMISAVDRVQGDVIAECGVGGSARSEALPSHHSSSTLFRPHARGMAGFHSRANQGFPYCERLITT